MAQFLKKFDNVLLASMKKVNNNLIPNTIRINGVLLQNTPTPTRTYLCPESDVTIGTQIWTVCNLNVTTYNDGTIIPQVTGTTGVNAWSGLTTGAWCYYNNVTITGNTYGKLYNWYAVAGIYDAASASNPSLRKKLAPSGYHIPTESEWITVIESLGTQSGVPTIYQFAGGKMKLSGTTYWNAPNPILTPYSGFRALPGGYRSNLGTFSSIRTNGYWWTSSEYDLTTAYYITINSSSTDAFAGGVGASYNWGLSVRLIQDLPATPTPTPTITQTITPTLTITPTQTPTRTQTPTPTSYPVLPTCSVLYNDDNANVFYYNVSANTSTQLTVTGFPIGPSIAHTTNKLWGSSAGASAFTEYNISLPSFVATFSGNKSFPSGYKPSKGLAAISDTVILAVNTNTTPHQVVEINVSGTSIMTTKFSLMSNREITGDFYKTTTNKFLALTTDTTTLNAYLTQWDYLTGTLEVDSQLSLSVLDTLETWGLFQYNNNIYITSTANGVIPEVSKTYIVNKDSPYNLTYSVTTQKLIVDASQIPSCLTTNLNAPSPYLCSLNDVTIGTQTWTACNLNVATYRDGTVIPQVTDPTAWSGLTTGAWCYYENNSITGATYGMLYNWYAVAGIDGSGTPRDLAPIGYRVPTSTEWNTLTTFIGGESNAGTKLKEAGYTHWYSHPTTTPGTNIYGFTALPGGWRYLFDTQFYQINAYAFFWTKTSVDSVTGLRNNMSYLGTFSNQANNPKRDFLSVRLIKDVVTPTPTPTHTVTPTITPTHTPTPTITPTVTPTRAPIVVNADYLVFTYTFPTTSGVDLDTLTYLYVNNVTGTTYANVYNPIGFCSPIRFTCTPQPNCTIGTGKWGGPNLWWGGDNINSGGTESVYVDIKQLKLSGAVDTIQLNCRANWYRDTPNTGTGIVKIQMQAFSGGTMISDGNYGFSNTGGVLKATYIFSDSTILASNGQCAGTDCVGFFTYTLSTGTFVKSNTCIP